MRSWEVWKMPAPGVLMYECMGPAPLGGILED